MAEREVELINDLRVLWQRKWLILGSIFVAALIALVSSINAPKTYKGKPL
jgi:LPS O-antigen subunit length determinant protein (WzzB/FepE family)